MTTVLSTASRPPVPEPRRQENDLASYDARKLITNGVQARITLDDQTYYLRITRAGKLILTK